ncbi:MAG: c-type cytochrome biogenesis protein CcmI [Alphaproteobacteria bacterium]|nr:c-type cytochrome biogenesis protein CcmI [Alphaproteobacteria bacterium]
MIWLVALPLAATLAIWLAQPMLRARRDAIPRRSYDLAVYRDQLEELERDVARGLIGAAEAAAAKAEIARRMLALDREKAEAAPAPSARPWLAVALAAALPLAGILAYAGIGRPGLPAQPAASRPQDPTAAMSPEQRDEMIRGMVASLAARLEQNPDDLQGWRRLARSYRVLGDVEAARRAAERAVRLAPDDIDVLGEFAELNAPTSTEEPMSAVFIATLERLQAIKPDHVQALFFLGLNAMRTGDIEAARTYWERVLKALPADAPIAAELRQRIDALRKPR